MKNVSYMDVLNHTPHMQTIVKKLPAYLQSKWRDKVLSIRQIQRCANFSDLVQFVEHAAETSNDPVYSKEASCKLEERTKIVRNMEQTSKKPPLPSKRGTTRSLATSLTSSKNSEDGAGSAQQHQKPVKCPLCEKPHDVEDCKDVMKKTLEERKKFVADRHLCFACYGTSHRSKGCTNKRVCKTCSKPHPTSLQVENFNPKERSQPKDESKSERTTVGSTCTDTKDTESSLTTTTQNVVLHAILPVTVRTDTGSTTQTYALYDNGSSGSFITEELKERIDVKGIDTTLQLGTMHGHSSIKSSIVEGLIVSDLKDNNPVKLSRCYSRSEIPVSQKQIPTPEAVGKLESLHQIASDIPELVPDLAVGLLIGSDCPQALEPLEVVPSGGEGPFAMRLLHGWTVNGPMQLEPDNSGYYNSHRITVKDVESIKEVMTPQSVLNMFELDFNDRSSNSDACGMSREDKAFLEAASQGIRQIDGHYELPLPFRDTNVCLPNNRLQAVKRAEWQKKKMLRDDKYREDYVNFINDITICKEGSRRKVSCKRRKGVVHPSPRGVPPKKTQQNTSGV